MVRLHCKLLTKQTLMLVTSAQALMKLLTDQLEKVTQVTCSTTVMLQHLMLHPMDLVYSFLAILLKVISFLELDYMPNRMFNYDGTRWVKYKDDVRMTLSNTLDRYTHRTSFINNTNTKHH